MKKNEGMKDRKFRNHISIILEQTGAFIAVVFVFIITQLFQKIDELAKSDFSFITDRGFLIFPGVIALFAVIVTGQLLVWSKTYISIEGNAIVIEKGRVNKKKNTIGIRNISNINLEQNLFEMVLGTCKVKLDTNSRSTADSTDVKILLKKCDALWFHQEIARRMEEEAGADAAASGAGNAISGTVCGEPEEYDVHAGIADMIQHGFFSISLISVSVFILAIIGTVGSVVEMLSQEKLMESLTGALAGIVVVVFIILSTLWDTVKDFIRYYDFRAKRLEDKIYIKYGFLKKVEYTIPVDKIQALKIRQSLLARVGHRYKAEIINVGMGDDKEEQNSFLVLYCKQETLKERLSLLLPEFACSVDQPVDRLPVSVWAAWTVPAIVYILIAVSCAFVCNTLTENKYCVYVWPAAAVLVILLFVGMVLKYRTAGAGADDRYLKIVRGYFSKEYLTVRYRDIQYVQFSQSFIAKACGIKKGEIRLLASSLNTSHDIPYFKGSMDEIIKRGMLTF